MDSKNIIPENKLIELRSEEVQEVLGQVPSWILRYGITVLFSIVIVLLAGSWFFKYPDIIEAPVIVTSLNPPVQINARVTGKITGLLIKDRQKVRASDYLAILENPANINDIEELKTQLPVWQNMVSSGNPYFNQDELKRKYELGDIQTPYLSFIRSATNYILFKGLNYYPQQIAAVENQILRQKQHYNNLNRQYEVVKQQYELAHRKHVRDSTMFAMRIIAEDEFDAASISFLQSRHSLESSGITLDNANIQIEQLHQSVLDLKLQELEKHEQLLSEIKTGLDNLINSFNTWEMNYVLKTPVAGIVDISRYWNINQNITSGETVFTIIPETQSGITGKAQLPIAGSGKVKPGQAVNVRFLNFPDTEYGIVRGIVGNISIVPSGESYLLEIEFPNSLITTYGKELPFYQEMHAVAEIITDDLRLLERLFLPLKKILANNKTP